jgi:hypothetical protein
VRVPRAQQEGLGLALHMQHLHPQSYFRYARAANLGVLGNQLESRPAAYERPMKDKSLFYQNISLRRLYKVTSFLFPFHESDKF